MPFPLGTKTLTSTNAYVTILEVEVPPHVTKVSIEVVENNVNAIKYKVDGTIDGTKYEEIKAEATLAKNASIDLTPSDSGLEKLADPWLKIRVQHKSDVADTHGNTTVTAIGS